MAGWFGKVAATAAGIALYEVGVRPLIASRLMGKEAQLDEQAELERELDDADRELERAERELDAQDAALLDDF